MITFFLFIYLIMSCRPAVPAFRQAKHVPNWLQFNGSKYLNTMRIKSLLFIFIYVDAWP